MKVSGSSLGKLFFYLRFFFILIKGLGLQKVFLNSDDGLERLTFCHKFYENPLIYKKVIEV